MNRPQTQPAKLGPLLAVFGLLLAAWFSVTQTASAVCLPQDHSDLFAATLSPGGHQEKDALPPKNRVWENFGNPTEITPADEVNSLQLRWKTHFSDQNLTSGIPVFLNADPIGFSGGSNWFAYADGNPISLSDPFGLCAQNNRCTSGQTYGSGSVPYPKWNDTTPWVHGALDGFGLIPGAGEFADGANAAIYLAEGSRVDAGISAAAMIPFAGWGVTGAKGLKYIDEAFEIGEGVRRAKAADMLGHGNISAQILREGKADEFVNLPLASLRSPKEAIDASSFIDAERMANVLEGTRSGTVPPIIVRPGSRGLPIKDVKINYPGSR